MWLKDALAAVDEGRAVPCCIQLDLCRMYIDVDSVLHKHSSLPLASNMPSAIVFMMAPPSYTHQSYTDKHALCVRACVQVRHGRRQSCCVCSPVKLVFVSTWTCLAAEMSICSFLCPAPRASTLSLHLQPLTETRQLLLVSRRWTQRASQPANTAFARWGRGRYAAVASGQFRSAVHGYQGNDC